MKRRKLIRRRDGVKQHYHIGRIRRMTSTYRIPHWLFEQITPEERKEAERMLYIDKMNISEVADYFMLKNPWRVIKRPQAFWTRKAKILFIRMKAEQLGRTPYITDIDKGRDGISGLGLSNEFGNWNDYLEAALIEPINPTRPETLPVVEKIRKFGKVPTAKELDEDNRRKKQLDRFWQKEGLSQAVSSQKARLQNLIMRPLLEERLKSSVWGASKSEESITIMKRQLKELKEELET